MIRPYESKEDETPQVAAIEINPAMKKHWKTEIKILRDAPRNENKLRRLWRIKERQYEESTCIEDIHNLVTEIEMLKFVLFLVCRNESKEESARHHLW